MMRAAALLLSALLTAAPPAAAQAPARDPDAPFTGQEFRSMIADFWRMHNGSGALAQVESSGRQFYRFAVRDFGPDSREVLELEHLIARAMIRQEKIDEARAAAETTLGRAMRLLPATDPLLFDIAGLYVQALYRNGDVERGLTIGANLLLEAERLLGADHPKTTEVRLHAARAAVAAGAAGVAHAHFGQVVAGLRARGAEANRQLLAVALGDWGQLLYRLGAPEEALVRYDEAAVLLTERYAAVKNGDVHPDIVLLTERIAGLLWETGQGEAMRARVDPMLARVEAVYGRDSVYWAALAYRVAPQELGDGSDPVRVDRAIEMLTAVEAARARLMAPNHLDLFAVRELLGGILAFAGRTVEALEVFGRTLEAGIQPRRDMYVYAVGRAMLEDHLTERDAAAEMLRFLQALQGGGAAQAQAMLNARLALRDDAAGQALRDLTDLRTRAAGLRDALSQAVAGTADARDAAAEARLRADLSAADRAIEAQRARIEAELPAVAAVSGATVLTLDDVQALLPADEALVILDSAAEDSGQNIGIVVTRDDVHLYSIDATTTEIAGAVAEMRAAVEMRLGVRAAVALSSPAAAPAGAFPLDRAHWLHGVLLDKAAPLLDGKRLLHLDLRGPLTALPPQMLVASPPASDDPAAADWLIRRHAIAVLPAISALRTGTLAADRRAPEPLLAFADPVFGDVSAAPAALRGALAPLPETVDEVRAVAQAVRAGDGAARFGAAATEAALKAAPLADFRVLYFATHGLVAGEVAGGDGAPLAEPALALTAGQGEDGFLTASEIAELRLNADWVVLSACNTAVGGVPGAEPLSGLAQAFLYAGARALLVSHWPVESRSAVVLMSSLFRIRSETTGLRAAEAQRQAILSMIDAPPDPRWSHPAYWAPFILVGSPD